MAVVCKKVDVSLEKRILIGFIVSTDFVKKVSRIYDKNYFSANSSKIIADWCIEYFITYEKAPNKHIADIYLINKRKNTIDEDDQEAIEDLLESLSSEWEEISVDFNAQLLVIETVDFFNEKKLIQLRDKLEQCIDDKDIASATAALGTFTPHQVSVNAEYINPFSDEGEIDAAFDGNSEPLFKMPGALGKMVNAQLYRGGFIGIQAPEKSCKSFILQEFVMRALRNRLKVALFELGDMTKKNRICRIGSYVARLPFVREKMEDGVMKCKIPELLEVDGGYIVKFSEVSYPILTKEAAKRAGKKWIKRCGKDTFRVSVHASDTISMGDVSNILQTWSDVDGWEPDVIAIDYPEISRAEKGVTDIREGVNIKWKTMRRIAQERDALLIAPTQADAKSYGKSSQNLKNFSEDKRKYSHVTAIYAINQTFQEKAQNIFRLAPLLVREGYSDTSRHVAIVHCLDLGRPYMFSYEVDATNFDDVDDDDE